jgi:CRP/FNR family cyclic AMP-dependent transcriptional regulator
MPLRILPTPNACQSCQFRSLRMFCNLTPVAVAAFGALGTSASFPRGATLFHEGDACNSVLVLCSGQAKLSCVSSAGKTMILKIAGPGDLLGLTAAVAALPQEVTAEAIEPIQIRNIPRAAFLAFLEQFGEASLNAARAIQSEYRNAFLDARLLSLTSSAAGRLAHVLLSWAESVACSGTTPGCAAPPLRFNMALTHEELGSMANLSRETVTRVLSRFRKEKLVSIHGVAFTILAPDRLRALVAD